MEKQTITIYDVAREANVSMATVSRVVNGNQTLNQQQEKSLGSYRSLGLSSKRSCAWLGK